MTDPRWPSDTAVEERWREGPWGMDRMLSPHHVPMHVREALHFGWSPYFALLPVRLVDGRRVWLKRVERRQVHAPDWFCYITTGWQEYRCLPVPPSRGDGE